MVKFSFFFSLLTQNHDSNGIVEEKSTVPPHRFDPVGAPHRHVSRLDRRKHYPLLLHLYQRRVVRGRERGVRHLAIENRCGPVKEVGHVHHQQPLQTEINRGREKSRRGGATP